MTGDGSQRIDKWLWQARFFKTRGLAAKFSAAGRIRLATAGRVLRVVKASAAVRPNDILTLPLRRGVKVVRVLAIGERRGSPAEAACLYEEIGPPTSANPEATPLSARLPGSGRPTKRQRRQLDRLRRTPL